MENTTEQKNNKPLKSFRAGNVSAAVWSTANGKNGEFLTATFSRSYQDKDNGEIKNAYNFSEHEIGNLQRVAKDTKEYINEHNKERGNETLDRFDARKEQSHEDQSHEQGR